MDKKRIIVEIKKRRDLVENKKVAAVYLFGSVADERDGPMSDIDICIVDNEIDLKEKFEIIRKFADEFDVSFFSDMPIWMKMRALKGIPVIVNNKNLLYNISFETLREYEDFMPLLRNRMMRRFGKCTI